MFLFFYFIFSFFVNVFVWCFATGSKRDGASPMQCGNDDTLGGSFGKVRDSATAINTINITYHTFASGLKSIDVCEGIHEFDILEYDLSIVMLREFGFFIQDVTTVIMIDNNTGISRGGAGGCQKEIENENVTFDFDFLNNAMIFEYDCSVFLSPPTPTAIDVFDINSIGIDILAGVFGIDLCQNVIVNEMCNGMFHILCNFFCSLYDRSMLLYFYDI